MRRTRRRLMSAGRKLGTGAHGIAYNVGENYEGDTFYSLITWAPIKSIKLYSSDGFYKSYFGVTEIEAFILYIKETRECIAKVLKAANSESDFEKELSENRRIISLYGDYADSYLTVAALPEVLRKDLIGCVVTFTSGSKIYSIFGKKCENRYTMDLIQFATDILESLEILQASSHQHNDIKLDNIVKCDDRYKLIDWAQCSLVTDFSKAGTLISTSPIKWYLMGHSHFVSKSLITYRTTFRNFGFSRSSCYREVLNRVLEEYDIVLKTGVDRDSLALKYAYSFDVFMLGMTMLHAVYKYKLDFDKYKGLIFKFTSLKDPVKNAIEASRIVKEFALFFK